MNRPIALFLALLAAVATTAGNFLSELPDVSAIVSGYNDIDSVTQRLETSPLTYAEGLWQMADGGATFAIERDNSPERLRLIMVKSPRRSVRPGTVLGHARPTPDPQVYEAALYCGFAQRTGLNLPRKFLLRLNSTHTTLTFEPFKSPLKINLFRMLPYMFRRVITPQQSRPDGLDGAIKIAPAAAPSPHSPVYL